MSNQSTGQAPSSAPTPGSAGTPPASGVESNGFATPAQRIPDVYGPTSDRVFSPPSSGVPPHPGAANGFPAAPQPVTPAVNQPSGAHQPPPVGQSQPPSTSPHVGPGSVTGGINKSQVAEAVRTARQSVTAAASRNARRNRLQLRRIDPWSVMKFSFAASLVLFIAFVIATALLYSVLAAMGVFDSINETVSSLVNTSEESGNPSFAINAKMVIGGAALLGAVNMVLFTASATLGAFIYNVCADLAGGIELTLAERE